MVRIRLARTRPPGRLVGLIALGARNRGGEPAGALLTDLAEILAGRAGIGTGHRGLRGARYEVSSGLTLASDERISAECAALATELEGTLACFRRALATAR